MKYTMAFLYMQIKKEDLHKLAKMYKDVEPNLSFSDAIILAKTEILHKVKYFRRQGIATKKIKVFRWS